MSIKQDWLWDRKFTPERARKILRDPRDEHFLSLAGLLLSRKNTPKEIFTNYLKPLDFLLNWHKIKSRMRKDDWNNPRIEFWQAIFEKLRERYKEKGVEISKKAAGAGQQDEFCKATAEKIRLIRKQKGLTQQQLAQKLKISQQIISRIESGRENVSLLTLKRITDSLGAQLNLEIS